jgi:hypothetical protein
MTATTTGRRRGAWKIWATLAVVVGVTVLVLPDDSGPYDLDSAEVDGYRALRLMLESFGGRVEAVDASRVTGASVSSFDAVLVPTSSGASQAQIDRWTAFADSGGTLVLGEPRGAEAPSGLLGLVPGTAARPPGACPIRALRDVGEAIAPLSVSGIDAGSDAWCFGDRTDALVVEHEQGRGRVVTLASPKLWTNEMMGMAPEDQKVVAADELPANSVVAQLLLAPAGGGRIAVVTSGVAASTASGGESLTSILPTRVKLAIWEIVAAFGFYVWFRARRHGRLIREATPVTLAGSQLVDAVGNLRRRISDRGRVASALRAQTRTDLAKGMGLTPTAPVAQVAAVLAERGIGTVDELTRALGDDDVVSDADLVALARTLDTIRREALHV